MWGHASELALEDDVEAGAEKRAERAFERADGLAGATGEVIPEVEVGNPRRAILNSAGKFDAAVIGTHGGTLSDQLSVDNVSQEVSHRSPVPVIVVR